MISTLKKISLTELYYVYVQIYDKTYKVQFSLKKKDAILKILPNNEHTNILHILAHIFYNTFLKYVYNDILDF